MGCITTARPREESGNRGFGIFVGVLLSSAALRRHCVDKDTKTTRMFTQTNRSAGIENSSRVVPAGRTEPSTTSTKMRSVFLYSMLDLNNPRTTPTEKLYLMEILFNPNTTPDHELYTIVDRLAQHWMRHKAKDAAQALLDLSK